MGMTRKKRKGSEADECSIVASPSPYESGSSFINIRAHYSLEDYARLKKKCKEDVGGDKPIGSLKNRLAGIATAPPCGASSLVLPGRGLKRKIGCIDVATQLGRKNKIEDDYVLGETIGHGKFGSVYSCKSRANGVEYACKTLKKGEETVHREVEIMQHLSGHPGVVTLQAVYEDPDCFHLVMELCSGGRLVDQMVEIGQYSEHRAANMLKELMLVIKYCHDMGVVHRDIKPENILLTSSGKMKLADFGLAMRVAKGQNLTGLAGSPAYVAPDVLLGNYSEKVDIWSAGVLLHLLLIGGLPFQGDSLESVFVAIKSAELDFNIGRWDAVSKPARDLVGRMLTRDVSARITADEVLRHPWILFYTERTLKTFCIKSKSKTQLGSSSGQIAAGYKVESLSRVGNYSVSEGSSSALSSKSMSCKLDDNEDCGLVDALTVAISHVRISEPKRSRLCGPVRVIAEQHSSNLTANTLCKAF